MRSLWLSLAGTGVAAAAAATATATATAAATTTSLVLDGGDWQLCSGSTGGACLPNATVPGGVWDNLRRAGVVGDPRYRNNDVVFSNATTAMWTPGGGGFARDVRVWTFAKDFDVPAALLLLSSSSSASSSSSSSSSSAYGAAAAAAGGGSSSYVALELDGVQTNANVSLNGVPLITGANNMFRQWRAELPTGLLRPPAASSGHGGKGRDKARDRGKGQNRLVITVASSPSPATCSNPTAKGPAGLHGPCTDVRVRAEADAWGWDWSPSLGPVAVWRSVRLVAAPPAAPYLASWSPQVSVTAMAAVAAAAAPAAAAPAPSHFLVNASFSFLVPAGAPALGGTVTLSGDWGGNASTQVSLPASAAGATAAAHVTVHAALAVAAADIKLWWPRHYGAPNTHALTATVAWGGDDGGVVDGGGSLVKRIGFRSVALSTGPALAVLPAKVDPAHAAAFVGCFRDGNIFWGGPQHALPHYMAGGDDAAMTVGKCLGMCAKAGFALAGLQGSRLTDSNVPSAAPDQTKCFCGDAIGPGSCDGCLPGVGTAGDSNDCVTSCSGDPAVACGGISYMWSYNSVYNVTPGATYDDGAAAAAAAAAAPAAVRPRLAAEGNGGTDFALVVNGVRVFSRGANLVPFELLEQTVDPAYVRRTVQSVADGNMNMLRLWGGGTYQGDAFFDACDALGIMVFHDMMFSYRLYPHDAAFRSNVRAEISAQVAAARHHPSIVMWDASNENDGDTPFFYDTVLAAVARADDSRPLWPASPSTGFATGVHTETGLPNGNVLRGSFGRNMLDSHQPYDYCTAAFVTSTRLNQTTLFKSEFGQVALPAFETLAPALNGSAGDFGVNSPIMVHRKHAGATLGRPISSLFGGGVDLDDVTEANFRRVIFLSQLAQALCLKTTLEEFRRGERTSGALIWQLNDVWQASSWGSLDYGGRWRALHHSLQAVFAPTLVSLWVGPEGEGEDAVRVHGSQHGAMATEGVPLSVEVNITAVADGSVARSDVVPWAPASTADVTQLLRLPLSAVNGTHQVITTRVLGIGASETTHLLQTPSLVAWVNVSRADVTLAAAMVGKIASVALANAGAAPLFYALVTSTFAGRFSRNLLTVPPRSSRVVDFIFEAGQELPSAAEFESSMHLDWMNRDPAASAHDA